MGTCTDTIVIVPETSPDGYVVTSIGERAFAGNDKIGVIIALGEISSIGDEAFKDCPNLYAAYTSQKVVSIGDRAFAGCSFMTGLWLSDGLEMMGEGVFEGCSALEEVILPKTLTSVGDKIFAECTSLKIIMLFCETFIDFDALDLLEPSEIYVIEELIDEYKSADGWSDFADIIAQTYAVE